MFSDQVPHKDYLSTFRLDLTLKFFSEHALLAQGDSNQGFFSILSLSRPELNLYNLGEVT